MTTQTTGDTKGAGDGSVWTTGTGQGFKNTSAFAALKSDGSVVTWGMDSLGGDSSTVASQLKNGVAKIFSSTHAFAALKSDGSVVTWGYGTEGGDSSSVATQITSGVTKVYSTSMAFAAVKSDGSVVTWGADSAGGNSSTVATQLTGGIQAIQSTSRAFAALKSDGSVVAWGDRYYGGDSSSVASKLDSGVVELKNTSNTFAALKSDGSVVTWGRLNLTSAVAKELESGVKKIYTANAAFAALKADGSVVTWGGIEAGGDSSRVEAQLRSDVQEIFSNAWSFAALKSDGSVVTWGNHNAGGNSSVVSSQLSGGVVKVFSTDTGFAALKSDGSVVTWGGYGGESSSVAAQLSGGVEKIYSTRGAFAALKTDGSVVVWGYHEWGGATPPEITDQLGSNVKEIYTTDRAFSALKTDGSVVTWGRSLGDTSVVATQLSSGVTGFASPAGYVDTPFTPSAPANQAPTDIALSTTQIASNAAQGDVVANISATDPDGDTAFTYEVVSPGGAAIPNPLFTISGSQLVRTDAPKTSDSEIVHIRVTDSKGGQYTEGFKIGFTEPENQAPTDIRLSNVKIAVGSKAGEVVGDLTATDPDAGDTFVFSLAQPNANFEIVGNQLKIAPSASLAPGSTETVAITVKDSGDKTYTENFSITVANPDPVVLNYQFEYSKILFTAFKSTFLALNPALASLDFSINNAPRFIEAAKALLSDLYDKKIKYFLTVEGGYGTPLVGGSASYSIDLADLFGISVEGKGGYGGNQAGKVTTHISTDVSFINAKVISGKVGMSLVPVAFTDQEADPVSGINAEFVKFNYDIGKILDNELVDDLFVHKAKASSTFVNFSKYASLKGGVSFAKIGRDGLKTLEGRDELELSSGEAKWGSLKGGVTVSVDAKNYERFIEGKAPLTPKYEGTLSFKSPIDKALPFSGHLLKLGFDAPAYEIPKDELWRLLAPADPTKIATSITDGRTGSVNSDRIEGTDGVDYIEGGAATDFLFGKGGNDFIWGGSQFDFISAGAGDDKISGDQHGALASGGQGSDEYYVFVNDDDNGGADRLRILDAGTSSDKDVLTFLLTPSFWRFPFGADKDDIVGAVRTNGAALHIDLFYIEKYAVINPGAEYFADKKRLASVTIFNQAFEDEQIETVQFAYTSGKSTEEKGAVWSIDLVDFANKNGYFSKITEADRVSFDDLQTKYLIQTGRADLAAYSDNLAVHTAQDADQELVGSKQDDTINGGFGNDEILPGQGNDVADAGDGFDKITDGLGNNWLKGGDKNDEIVALSGRNVIEGENGNDLLVGGFQSDALKGGAGFDLIRGDAGRLFGGSDTLWGGADDDILMGGRGADTFVFRPNEGYDRIAAFDVNRIGDFDHVAHNFSQDFETGVDTVALEGFSSVNQSNVLSFVNDVNGIAQFEAEGTSIVSMGLSAGDLNVDDFVFI